jgi:hypothetical protein
MCRTTDPLMLLLRLSSLDELPDVGTFDPSPVLDEDPRERRLRAGEGPAVS